MTIAERISLNRQQKGLSQKELSEKSSVNLKSLSRYELASSILPVDALNFIADTLCIPTDHLLSDEQVGIRDCDLLKKFDAIREINGINNR